jgi:glycerol-3-phosphate acyltransferase PlsY
MFVITFLYYKGDANANLHYVITMVALGVAYAALIIGKHHENIARLRAGTEKKITPKKKEA